MSPRRLTTTRNTTHLVVNNPLHDVWGRNCTSVGCWRIDEARSRKATATERESRRRCYPLLSVRPRLTASVLSLPLDPDARLSTVLRGTGGTEHAAAMSC